MTDLKQAQTHFVELMAELFQLDEAQALDFGIYHLPYKWEGLAEYRWLDVRDGGTRTGWLVGLDRQIGENFKVGVGYNFTDFSDDLTDLEYDHRGWFLNLAGYY